MGKRKLEIKKRLPLTMEPSIDDTLAVATLKIRNACNFVNNFEKLEGVLG